MSKSNMTTGISELSGGRAIVRITERKYIRDLPESERCRMITLATTCGIDNYNFWRDRHGEILVGEKFYRLWKTYN